MIPAMMGAENLRQRQRATGTKARTQQLTQVTQEHSEARIPREVCQVRLCELIAPRLVLQIHPLSCQQLAAYRESE